MINQSGSKIRSLALVLVLAALLADEAPAGERAMSLLGLAVAEPAAAGCPDRKMPADAALEITDSGGHLLVVQSDVSSGDPRTLVRLSVSRALEQVDSVEYRIEGVPAPIVSKDPNTGFAVQVCAASGVRVEARVIRNGRVVSSTSLAGRVPAPRRIEASLPVSMTPPAPGVPAFGVALVAPPPPALGAVKAPVQP